MKEDLIHLEGNTLWLFGHYLTKNTDFIETIIGNKDVKLQYVDCTAKKALLNSIEVNVKMYGYNKITHFCISADNARRLFAEGIFSKEDISKAVVIDKKTIAIYSVVIECDNLKVSGSNRLAFSFIIKDDLNSYIYPEIDEEKKH